MSRLIALTLFTAACGGSTTHPGPDADPTIPDADPAAVDADPTSPDAAPFDPACDPITQKSASDTANTYCGLPLDGDGKQEAECVGLPAAAGVATTFACEPVRTPPTGSVDNGDGHLLTVGETFDNSCGPRALPLLFESTDTIPQMICVALCVPDPDVLAGVAPLVLTGAGEECRYWWWLEDAGALPSVWQNSLGFALIPANYHYIAGGAEQPFPSCADVTSADLDGDGTADDVQWGCAPKVTP